MLEFRAIACCSPLPPLIPPVHPGPERMVAGEGLMQSLGAWMGEGLQVGA